MGTVAVTSNLTAVSQVLLEPGADLGSGVVEGNARSPEVRVEHLQGVALTLGALGRGQGEGRVVRVEGLDVPSSSGVLARGPAVKRSLRRRGGDRRPRPDRATLGLEDLLVVLADTCWKGKRDRVVEEAVAAGIAAATGQPTWKVFMKLDGIVEALAADADARLDWQALFSASNHGP